MKESKGLESAKGWLDVGKSHSQIQCNSRLSLKRISS